MAAMAIRRRMWALRTICSAHERKHAVWSRLVNALLMRKKQATETVAISVMCYCGIPGLGKSFLTGYIRTVLSEHNVVCFSKDEMTHRHKKKRNQKKLRMRDFAQGLGEAVKQYVASNGGEKLFLVIDQNMNKAYLDAYLRELLDAGFHINSVARVASELAFAQQQLVAIHQAGNRCDNDPDLSRRSTLESHMAEEVLKGRYWGNPSVIPTQEEFALWVQDLLPDTNVRYIPMPVTTYNDKDSTWETPRDDELAMFAERVVLVFAEEMECTIDDMLYIGIELDQRSTDKVRALCQSRYGDRNIKEKLHVTLAFNRRQGREPFLQFIMWMVRSGVHLGDPARMFVTDIHDSQEPDVLTLAVDLDECIRCNSGDPHITVGLGDGVVPYQSLLAVRGKCEGTVYSLFGHKRSSRTLYGKITATTK